MAKGAGAVISAVKAHPYLTAGGVVALLLLMRAGGSASDAGGDYLGAAVKAREIGLQELTASLAAQTEQGKTQAQVQIARDAYAADMYKTATGAKTTMALASGEQATAQLMGMLNYRGQLQAARSAENIALTEINASKAVALDNNLTMLKAIDKTTNQQATLYSLIAAHDINKIQTEANAAERLLHVNYGGQLQLAQLDWEYANAALRTNASVARYMADKQAGTARLASTIDGAVAALKAFV